MQISCPFCSYLPTWGVGGGVRAKFLLARSGPEQAGGEAENKGPGLGRVRGGRARPAVRGERPESI